MSLQKWSGTDAIERLVGLQGNMLNLLSSGPAIGPCSPQISLTISGRDTPEGIYTPGEHFLPIQRIAPMAKDEVCHNLAYFLLRAFIHTYIHTYVYLFDINDREDRAVFQTYNMST